MYRKMMTVAICIAMALVAMTGIVAFSDSLDAADGDVIEVSTGAELIDAMQNRYELQQYTGTDPSYNYELTIAPVNISITDDIILEENCGFGYNSGLQGYVGTYYFSGTIDGNGHTITASFDSGWNYLAGYTAGTTTFKNIHIECEGGVFSMIMGAGVLTNVFYDGDTNVTFENVVLDKYVEASNNDSAFAVHAYNCTINFTDCINNASYNMSNNAAIFLGGMAVGDVTANFSGCINNGHITGVKAYMFIGNDSSNTSLSVTVDDECKNNGSITADQSGLFADFGSDTTFDNLNSQMADRTDLTSNIHTTTDLGITASYEEGTNKIIVSGTQADHTYEVSMLVYATILGGGGTYNMTLTVPLTDNVCAGWFLDKSTAQQRYNLDVSGEYVPIGSTPFSYKTVITEDGQTIYIVDLGPDASIMTLSAKPTVRITAFDSDGQRLGSIQMDSISTSLPAEVTTHRVTFTPGSYTYTIISEGGNIVVDGESFQFTVAPASGYEIQSVAYNGTVLTATDGSYTIDDVTDDVTISVVTSRVSCDVIVDLENVTLSNSTKSVAYGESYETTFTVTEGYELSSITVIMAGVEYEVSGNTIMISEVTGNILITAVATPATPDPEPEEPVGPGTPTYPPIDDDDDYVPLPPQIVYEDSEGDDDTVTIVACAAASVVAALMAVYLIISYRKD